MADRGSVAARRLTALNKIKKTAPAIASALGIEAPSIPTTGRDVGFLQMQQLEAFADFLEVVADRLAGVETEDNMTSPPLSGDEREALIKKISRDFTLPQLIEIAQNRGIELSDDMKKGDVISHLVERGFRGLAYGGETDGDATDQ
jgi:hypothetical protein